ncbi:MAG: virulence RhuM family protein, partial [Cytophagales bacterium]
LIAELFQTTKQNIGQHLKNIFAEGELQENSVVKKFFTTAADGKQYNTAFYNLDAIISVGYRVNSQRATLFRQWATSVLRDFAIRGYVLDKERLKNGAFLSKTYFDDLLAEIREIRASERNFYQKITDIYATAMDYKADDVITQTFFASVQNKLHFAIHGHTAAELIVNRANSEKEHMGLTTWKNAPSGKIIKTDVSVAKNYLTEKELKSLDRFVTMYLDYAETQAERNIPMTMNDWAGKLNAFLQFNEKDILKNAGKVTQAIAKAFAESEFEKYRIIQDKFYVSDFDKEVKKLTPPKKKK